MLPPTLLSYKKNLDGDGLDHNGAPIEYDDPADVADEAPDPANIADTDAFEELAQNNTCFVTTNTDQPTINESPHVPEGPEQLPNDMEAGSTGAMPTVVIDHFPSASAGAPIHGMCYNPPYFSPPLYPSASTPKPPAKPLPVLPPLPSNDPPKDATTHLPMPVQPPVEPLIPIPWNIH